MTGNHPVHYAAALTDATYGGTGITEALLPDGTGYAFDCGNCHPLSTSNHKNSVPNSGGGDAEVELTPTGAPPGSLRALNAADADYAPGGTIMVSSDGQNFTEGTCSGTYCHSYLEFSAPGPIPAPGVDFTFTGYPMSYPAFTVNVIRAYNDAKWGDTLSCGGCHGFPPRTEYPAVPAGVGDSHSWIDSYGYENLHGYAHGFSPIACATCHFLTISEQGTRSYSSSLWSIYEPVPIDSYLAHVNGEAEVVLSSDLITVNSSKPAYDLSAVAYASTTMTCSDVPCHLDEPLVTWGTPYRNFYNSYECNVCHQF